MAEVEAAVDSAVWHESHSVLVWNYRSLVVVSLYRVHHQIMWTLMDFEQRGLK